ncbi:hypothetical protein [Nocardia sp. NPDC049707]|uniref:hypothetical protein n=1 Tax=Nocardia sp. NPDC049707 TaxID=3154735 RepID=UPI00342B5504
MLVATHRALLESGASGNSNEFDDRRVDPRDDSPEEGTMITNKARGNTTRRLLAEFALIGAAMAVPMTAAAAPATVMPTPEPGVVQTDYNGSFGDGSFGSGNGWDSYDNQWTDSAKPWHGNPWHGNPWHGNPWHGNPWHGNPWHGFGNWGWFLPGWFGSS